MAAFPSLREGRRIDRGQKLASLWYRYSLAALFRVIIPVQGFVIVVIAVASAGSSTVKDQLEFVLVAELWVWPVFRIGALPSIELFSRGVLVINPLRVWWIPWCHVKSVVLGNNQIRLVLTDGRQVKPLAGDGSAHGLPRKSRQPEQIRDQIENARRTAASVTGQVMVWVDLYARVAVPLIIGVPISAAIIGVLWSGL